MQSQPRTEVSDEAKDVQLEVVREVLGRPLFLTARRFIRICRHIEQGESASEACRLELVTYQGFRQHVKRNPKYQRRLKQAEETREEFLREYHIANVKRHAPRNVLASLWWLERRFPNQFALKPVHRSEGSSEQPIGDRIDESQLRRYSELMAEFKRENEAKPPSLPAPETAGEQVA
ncbi:MAG: hypothetical protein WB696_21345 [Chthoniobacterales bacterium]